MANPIAKPILGSFEDIGESVVSQLKQIPKDVGQAALESVGMKMGSGKQGNTSVATPPPGVGEGPLNSWQQIDLLKDEKAKKDIARAALLDITTPRPKQKELSIWEQLQQEEEQKKLQKAQAPLGPVQLPSSGVRKVPGMKSAVKNKSAQQESSKNARQD